MEKYLFKKDDSENESNFIVRSLVDDILDDIHCEESKEELNFFDISKLNVDEESSSELQSSNSSSSSEIGRVYRVTDDDFNKDDDDTDDPDIFYSTDDLMLKFIELDDQINLNFENFPYPQTITELKSLWKKRFKLSTLGIFHFDCPV